MEQVGLERDGDQLLDLLSRQSQGFRLDLDARGPEVGQRVERRA